MPTHHQNFRLRGIPCQLQTRLEVRELVKKVLSVEPGVSLAVHSLAINPVEQRSKIATLSFQTLPSPLSDKSKNEWIFDHPLDVLEPKTPLVFDTHFSGFTPLHRSQEHDCYTDIIIISGLGGHALGSFKERDGPFVWIRDALPLDFPSSRILTYVDQSRLIVFVGHSLGGLVIKEAIVMLKADIDEVGQSILDSVSGFLFFGVPHLGMATQSLVPLFKDQPNRGLLESLNTNSALLRRLDNEYGQAFSQRCPQKVAFYETQKSPTAVETADGKWELRGPLEILVEVTSAICGSARYHPIDRNHRDMVKYSNHYDQLYTRVKIALRPFLTRKHNVSVGSVSAGNEPQGGFQWAVLVAGMVINCYELGTRKERLLDILTTIPETLTELYENILSDISDDERNHVTKLFQWVLFACRPLCAQELREALATDKDMTCTTISELRTHNCWIDSLKQFETYIKRISRGLIEFKTRDIWEENEPGGERWDREAQFVHQSVADYVLETFLGHVSQVQPTSRIQVGAGHAEILTSSWFLFDHIQKAEGEGFPLPDLLDFIHWKDNSGMLEKVVGLWRVLDPHNAHVPSGWPFIDATPLHALVAFGSKTAIMDFLNRDDIEVDGKDEEGNTPLLLAVSEHHEDIALFLLERSMKWQLRRESRLVEDKRGNFVDPNAQNDSGDTPLSAALEGCMEQMIVKLSEAGADPKLTNLEEDFVIFAISCENETLLRQAVRENMDLDGIVHVLLGEVDLDESDDAMIEALYPLLKAKNIAAKFRQDNEPDHEAESEFMTDASEKGKTGTILSDFCSGPRLRQLQ
ncbi:hypothetical protein CP533_4638 [Ophiocordyceps camponoti-saundersi (nom. inval.)]|nr:hypothetical protein CP533_4638 [Ophiocordyceps camponoti-saundersi (nom. inval.)]